MLRFLVYLIVFFTAAITPLVSSEEIRRNPLYSARNFTRLGEFQPSGKDSSRAITYFISEYLLTHTQALLECRDVFFGRLVTIYTFEQDEYIRLRLQDLNLGSEQVHTAGRWNSDVTRWEWSTTTTPTYYDRWGRNEPSSTTGSCIDLLGVSSSYGWVSRTCTNRHLFICEINI